MNYVNKRGYLRPAIVFCLHRPLMSYRRRSQSASTFASLPRRSLSTSCHSAIGKRICHSSTRSNVSSSKWDVEAWRSKRRRRNPSVGPLYLEL